MAKPHVSTTLALEIDGSYARETLIKLASGAELDARGLTAAAVDAFSRLPISQHLFRKARNSLRIPLNRNPATASLLTGSNASTVQSPTHGLHYVWDTEITGAGIGVLLDRGLLFHQERQIFQDPTTSTPFKPRWTKRKARRTPRQPAWTAEVKADKEKAVLDDLLALPKVFSVDAALNPWVGQVTRVELSNVIKELGHKRRRADLALATFEWMDAQQGRLRPNGHAYCLMLGILGRHGDLHAAERLFAAFEAASFRDKVHGYNAMISAYVRAGLHARAWDLYRRMIRPVADVSVPSSTKHTTSRNGSASSSSSRVPVLPVLVSTSPSTTGSSPLRTEPEDARDSRAAGSPEEDIPACFCGCPPDVVTFNTLISSSLKAGFPANRARQLFAEMTSRWGLSPNVRTYNALIAVVGAEGNAREAQRLLQQMREEGVAPDMFTFNTLIGMHGQAGDLEAAQMTLDEALSCGCSPTPATYTSLMSAYSAAGRYSDAISLFQRMKEQGTGVQGSHCRCRPDLRAYSCLVSVYKDAGMVEEAEAVVQEMREAGTPPNAVVYGSLIQAYGRLGMVEQAVTAFDRMLSEGCAPDLPLFNILMAALCKAGLSSRAASFLRRMRACGVTPDAVSYNTLIHGHFQAGLPAEAEKIFERMKKAGCEPDRITKSLLVRTFNEAGWHDKAAGVWRRVGGGGGERDVDASSVESVEIQEQHQATPVKIFTASDMEKVHTRAFTEAIAVGAGASSSSCSNLRNRPSMPTTSST